LLLPCWAASCSPALPLQCPCPWHKRGGVNNPAAAAAAAAFDVSAALRLPRILVECSRHQRGGVTEPAAAAAAAAFNVSAALLLPCIVVECSWHQCGGVGIRAGHDHAAGHQAGALQQDISVPGLCCVVAASLLLSWCCIVLGTGSRWSPSRRSAALYLLRHPPRCFFVGALLFCSCITAAELVYTCCIVLGTASCWSPRRCSAAAQSYPVACL
jgi:hypothetical protein